MTATLKFRTLGEARALVDGRLGDIRVAGNAAEITGVDFVLCEDFRTVMIFCDVGDEQDAVAIYVQLVTRARA